MANSITDLDTSSLDHPEQITMIAALATQLESHLPDAAALLMDAAAKLCVDANMHPSELVERFGHSHGMMSAAGEIVKAHGNAATFKQ